MIKSVKDSITEQSQIIMPQHINGTGRLFGGQLIEWIDIVASVVARRHSQAEVITAAIDNMQFKEGAHVNDTIVLIGKLTYVGRTSMEVRVDTYIENFNGYRKPINRAYLVMVALDNNEKPIEVPGLKIEEITEEAEWEAAIKRQEMRKERRLEGY